MEYILDEIALGQYSATQIAAAFMQMKLGDEIEDIKSDKFLFEKKEGRRGGRQNRRNDPGKPERRKDAGRQRGKGDKPFQGKKESYKESRNSRYAALRIKTKKQGD